MSKTSLQIQLDSDEAVIAAVKSSGYASYELPMSPEGVLAHNNADGSPNISEDDTVSDDGATLPAFPYVA